jgi:hypothetical protein
MYTSLFRANQHDATVTNPPFPLPLPFLPLTRLATWEQDSTRMLGMHLYVWIGCSVAPLTGEFTYILQGMLGCHNLYPSTYYTPITSQEPYRESPPCFQKVPHYILQTIFVTLYLRSVCTFFWHLFFTKSLGIVLRNQTCALIISCKMVPE